MSATVRISAGRYDMVLEHLFQTDSEHVVFLFLRAFGAGADVVDQMLIGADGFVHRSEYHVELTDEARAGAIKRAHDLGVSLAEAHSHRAGGRAAFSPSDLAGLEEFAPHVWWRLAHRPYFAFVFAPTSFDAVVWLTDPHTPLPLERVEVDGEVLRPTGITIARWGVP